MVKFPEHKCGLYLEHNTYKDVYEKIADRLQDDLFDDMLEEDRKECLRTGELWTLQWYKDTPVGFYFVAGPTLERVIELANKTRTT